MLTRNLSGERTETDVDISRMVFVFVSIFVCQRFNKPDNEMNNKLHRLKKRRKYTMMVQKVMDFVNQYDEEVGKCLYAESERQTRNLELIASENLVSEAVMMAMACIRG